MVNAFISVSVFVQCAEPLILLKKRLDEPDSPNGRLQKVYGLRGESGPKVFQHHEDCVVALVGFHCGVLALRFLLLVLEPLAVGAKQTNDPVTLYRPGRSHAQRFQMLYVDECHTLDAVFGTVEHLDLGCLSPPYIRPLQSQQDFEVAQLDVLPVGGHSEWKAGFIAVGLDGHHFFHFFLLYTFSP